MSTASQTQQLATLSSQLSTILSGAGLDAKEVALYNSQFSSPDSVAHSPYAAPLVGQQAPDFNLFDHAGKQVNLADIVKQGKHVVLFWFRGAWCPFCSIELASHNARAGDYAALNAELLGVTPTLQSGNAATVKARGLKYRLLSDVNNEVAKEYGTLNQLNEDLAAVHKKLGVDFEKLYGYDLAHLPHPGTFIISGKTGKLVYADVTRDYRTRIEPQVLIDVLKSL